VTKHKKPSFAFIQSTLKDIGITVNITTFDYARAEERMKPGDYDLTMGLYWFVPTVISLVYYSIEDQYNSMGTYGGLGFGVTRELTELAQAYFRLQAARNFVRQRMLFGPLTMKLVPLSRLADVSGPPSTARTGFVFNYNYHVIDLSGVTRK
jgi:hypothetical protein